MTLLLLKQFGTYCDWQEKKAGEQNRKSLEEQIHRFTAVLQIIQGDFSRFKESSCFTDSNSTSESLKSHVLSRTY